MIVKKVPSSKVKNKAVSIRDLADYIREPHNQKPQEKVLYANGRGFICDNHAAQREEMVALASESVRSKNPVNHYIMSWREGEQPSPNQVEDAVSIFLDECGLKEHQVIYALHKDTDNIHLHLAVNRVHPETLKAVEINRGFDLESAHKSIARIEHEQGWQSEQNGRYQVLENGELGRARNKKNTRQPSQKKRDMEHRTGEKSAERIAIEAGALIIKKAQTWEQLHRELAAQGMRYEKTGSGATVFVGEVGVKASSVDRDASLSKLQKRLGAYQPSLLPRQEVVQRKPEPIKADVPGWEEYITGRKAHYAEKEAARLAQARQQEQERKRLAEQQKSHREEVLRGKWQGKGDALNALRSVIAAKQAAEKAVLKEKQQRERKQLRQQFRPYPDFEQWQRLQQHPEIAEQWRNRASEPQRIEGDRSEPPTPRDIRAYKPEIVGREVHYTRCDDAPGRGAVSFIDKGKSIEIHDWRNRETTLAALQLSAQKWGSFTVTGNDEYKTMCVQLAAEHGFQITNPELQKSIQRERKRIQLERTQAAQSEQRKQFERYAEAVGADSYRVSSVKMREDGSKQTFILDKRYGVTRGFTPQEVAQRTPEMQYWEGRGENIHYTPLSDSKHHILIDDMNREKLDRLVKDGYQPAVVLESSPGHYQAILTVQKLGTSHDREVGKRLSEVLNREYGNPRQLGVLHPHRAPGYKNHEPKHQCEDGSYPVVRLLQAERLECVKALALSRQIDAEYQQKTALKGSDLVQAKPVLERATANDSANAAYQRHYRDVLKRQSGSVDLSRVDSMIAVRMRVTGHDQALIERVIRQCAPSIRDKEEGRDWNDYAQRTARYAYSAAGDRQVVVLSRYKQQWEKLEGGGSEQEHGQESVSEHKNSVLEVKKLERIQRRDVYRRLHRKLSQQRNRNHEEGYER